MSHLTPANQTLIIELSSNKIGYAAYGANGTITNKKLLGPDDSGRIALQTKHAVQGDLKAQKQIIDRIIEARDAAQDLGIRSYRIISTSAFRDGEHASDAGKAFAEKIKHETGLSVDILDGAVEAQYIATAILNDKAIKKADHGDSLLIDMGGRSTEFITVNKDNQITKIKSYPFGRLSQPYDAKQSIDSALNDFIEDDHDITSVIYSGSIYRKTVSEFVQISQDNKHTLFCDFMNVSTQDNSLATKINFPMNSIFIADILTSEIDKKIKPKVALTSQVKVPQGAIIEHPDKTQPIPATPNQPIENTLKLEI